MCTVNYMCLVGCCECEFILDWRAHMCSALVEDGTIRCEEEQDEEWYIQWDTTPVGYIDIQRCPGGIEETTGICRACLTINILIL